VVRGGGGGRRRGQWCDPAGLERRCATGGAGAAKYQNSGGRDEARRNAVGIESRGVHGGADIEQGLTKWRLMFRAYVTRRPLRHLQQRPCRMSSGRCDADVFRKAPPVGELPSIA